MIWKSLSLLCFTILLQWKSSCGEPLGCTPLMANRSLPLSNTYRQSENISSPTSFPSNQSVYCSWLVFVPKGFRIKVHFTSFDLRNSTNCTSSAVELEEKEGPISMSLGRYCGGHVPDDVVSTYNSLSVIYTATNGSTLRNSGFRASISLAPAKTCNAEHNRDANNNIELSGLNGTLLIPSLPLKFPDFNMKCRWTISVPSGNRIKLSFQVCDKCENVIHVEVRDSFNKNDPGYGPFGGNIVPPPVYSVGPNMVVTFVTDMRGVLRRFAARYEAIPSGGVCTRDNRIVQLNLTQNSTGRMSSPDYPLQFPPTSACYWRLKAPEGYHIKLQFTTINIQGNCKDGLKRDWIRVDDYFTTDVSSVASYWGKFCSGVQFPAIYSTRNELQVFFASNYTSREDEGSAKHMQKNTSVGFYATYGVTPQVGYSSRCRTGAYSEKPIILEEHMGALVSPGYPSAYPIITCTWKIKVPDGYIVEVNIKDFEMDCAEGSKLMVGEDSFCGSNKPGLLTSESDVKIHMIANVARDNRGFRATFSMTKPELAVASIVPWIVIAIVVVAVCVTMFISWRRRARGLDRGSSFRASIITRMRTHSSASHGDMSHG